MTTQTTPISPLRDDLDHKNIQRVAHITSSRVIARNAGWNVIGRLAPMIVAVALTPQLVHSLGPSRWGVFTIALTITGMMGFFDFGIGRALARSVAVNIGSPHQDSASEVITGILALTASGIFGTVVLSSLIDVWCRSALQVPPNLEQEVRVSLYLICLCVPLMLLNATLSSILASHQRQRELNLVNIPVMILFYLCPLLVFKLYPNLIAVVLTLVVLRAVMTYGYWRLCLRAMPELIGAKPKWSCLKPLLQMGGWMTVSGLLSPLFMYFDRFAIATFVSAAATGFYITPNDLISKLQIVPVAINTTSFPAFAASYRNNPETTANIFRRSAVFIASALFIPALIVVLFSSQLLHFWLGAEFAAQAHSVFRWFGMGVLLAFAESSGIVIDAVGHPRLNAFWSFTEIAIFVPLVIFATRAFGIEGAAMAWVLKALGNFVSKTTIVVHIFPPIRKAAVKVVGMVVGGTIVLAVSSQLKAPSIQYAFSTVGIVTYFAALWFWAMTADERSRAFIRLKALTGLPAK